MSRPLALLAILAMFAAGCGKKPAPEPGGPAAEPELTGPEYTLKIQDVKKGDKAVVTDTTSGTTTTTVSAGAKGKKTEVKKGVERFEYTETVHEFPDGADRPTRVTRAYKVAEETEQGKGTKKFSYAGKTVLIEKTKAGPYSVTAGGRPLPKDEDAAIRKAFERPDKLKVGNLLPKKPVRVGESWPLDMTLFAPFAQDLPLPAKAEEGRGTGKLVKVYTQDGRQWGTIEVVIAFNVDGTRGGMALSGVLTAGFTLDAPVDGSAYEGVMKTRVGGKVTGAGNGLDLETVIDAEGTKTRTPAK